MNKVFKAGLLVSFFLIVTGMLHGYAQQNHFVYVQSDDKQPFSAVLDGKTFNSSAIGYVIIPKLVDGKYQLTISFPSKKFPDQQFSFEISKADIGFALKNYGAKGWGLFNYQSLDLTMSARQVQEAAGSNAFSNMLADAVNDTSLITPLTAKEEVKKMAVLKETAKETDSASQTQVIIVPKAGGAVAEIDPVAVPVIPSQNKDSQTASAINGTVQKIGQQVSDTGTNMVFVENGASGKDTVTIFVPLFNAVEVKPTDALTSVKAVPDSAILTKEPVKPAVAKQDVINMPDTAAAGTQINNPFYNNAAPPSAVEITNVAPAEVITDKKNDQLPPVVETGTAVAARKECKTMLADADFEKLRKKLFATSGYDKMIQAAEKYLQEKCITTAQAKTLSGNFLSDESRFNFFNVVYSHVSDPAAFASLQNQLIDPVYKNRFQALLK